MNTVAHLPYPDKGANCCSIGVVAGKLRSTVIRDSPAPLATWDGLLIPVSVKLEEVEGKG
jgi:hypothetical protein